MGLTEYLHTGGGQPPDWYFNIFLARLWHCKPWELDSAPLKWILRQLEASSIEYEVAKLRPELSDDTWLAKRLTSQ